MDQHQAKDTSSDKASWPGIPESTSHRTSMKWLTLESLRILQNRLAHRDIGAKVLLLTSTGYIQGYMADITDTYEEAIDADQAEKIDIASASVHLRTELFTVYGDRDERLELIDNGAVIHIHDAVMKLGGRKLRIPHLALFASEIIGYTLVSRDVL